MDIRVCMRPVSGNSSTDRLSRTVVRGRTGVGLLVALAAFGLLFSGPVQAAETPMFDLPEGGKTVVAKYDDKEITADELVSLVKEAGYRGPLTAEGLRQFETQRLDAFLVRTISNRALAEQARNDKAWERPATIDKDLKDARDRLTMQQLYRTVVLDKSTTPTEQEVRKYYDDNKEKFRVPFSFTMRHLFLSNYDEYTVKEGDTLESIAQQVAGDKAQAPLILVKATKRPPGEPEEETKEDKGKETDKPKEPAKEETPEKPKSLITPGEVLLVPMRPDKAEQVQRDIQSYYDLLKKGADFKEMAKKYSQAASADQDVRLTPSKEKPMLQEIVDAVKKTPVGSFSEPFRTKHGWQIVQVVDRVDESHQPFEKVKDGIRAQLRRDQDQKRADEFITKAFAETDALKINLNALKADAKPDDTLAQLGSLEYDRQDMLLDFPGGLAPALTEKEVRDKLRGVARMQRAVLSLQAETLGITKSPQIQEQITRLEDNALADAYARDLAKKKKDGVSTEDLRKFYDENKDSLFKTPRKLDLYVIALPIRRGTTEKTEDLESARKEAEQKLESLKAGLKDLESFKKAAAENSIVKPEESGHVGEVTTRYQNGLNGALEALKVKEVTGPISVQDKVYLLWAESDAPAETKPFEEIRDQVTTTYADRHARDWEQEVRKQILDKAGYKFLLVPAPTAAERSPAPN